MIVHVLSSLSAGGTERQTVLLARLQRAHHDVAIACLQPGGALREELGDSPPAVWDYPLTSLYDRNALRQIRRFARDLRRHRVSVVHTHEVYGNLFGLPAARLAGVQARIGSRRDVGGIVGRHRTFVELRAYRLANRVVANARAIAAILEQQGLPAHKIATIPNAVETDRFDPGRPRPGSAVALGLPHDRVLVAMVANFHHENKDQETFLRAAQQVSRRLPNVGFVLVGSGVRVPQLQGFAEGLGLGENTFFVQGRTNVAELLQLVDVCVSSSRLEGLPNAVLEYMAAGRPVVATDVGGTREAVVHEETGFLIDAGDDHALATRVIELLTNPTLAGTMGRRGRRRAEREFAPHLLLERTQNLYDSLLDRDRDRDREGSVRPQDSRAD